MERFEGVYFSERNILTSIGSPLGLSGTSVEMTTGDQETLHSHFKREVENAREYRCKPGD